MSYVWNNFKYICPLSVLNAYTVKQGIENIYIKAKDYITNKKEMALLAQIFQKSGISFEIVWKEYKDLVPIDVLEEYQDTGFNDKGLNLKEILRNKEISEVSKIIKILSEAGVDFIQNRDIMLI